MTDEIEDSGSGGFGWFLVGLGIGAAVGVLYAPKAGTETRDSLAVGARERTEYLKQKSKVAASQVADQVNDYVEQGKQAVDRGRSQVEDYVDRGRKVVAKHANKVSAAVDAGKNAYTTTTAEDGQF